MVIHVTTNTAILVKSFLQSAEHRGLSGASIRWYRVYLNQFASLYSQLPDSPELIEEFFSRFDGDERRHGAFRSIRAFYNFIEKRSDDFKNPIKKISPPLRRRKEKKSLTLAQLKTLLRSPNHSEEIRALLFLLADSGCRLGEAVRITHEDIFDDENGISIKLSGKSGTRIVPLSRSVKNKIIELTSNQPGRIFKHGIRWYSDKIREAFINAGFTGSIYSAHLLRHTFVSLARMDVLALKTMTGHSNLSMLEGYHHNQLLYAQRQHTAGSPLSQIFKPKGFLHQPIEFEDTDLLNIQDICHEILELTDQNKLLDQRIGELTKLLSSKTEFKSDINLEVKENKEEGS